MMRSKALFLLITVGAISILAYKVIWDRPEKFDSDNWKQKNVDWHSAKSQPAKS